MRSLTRPSTASSRWTTRGTWSNSTRQRRRRSGYRREQVVGRQLADFLIPSSLRERHREGIAHYLATGEGPVLGKRLELPALRADGTEFPVELAITRIPTDGPPLFTAYLRDITERKTSRAASQCPSCGDSRFERGGWAGRRDHRNPAGCLREPWLGHRLFLGRQPKRDGARVQDGLAQVGPDTDRL